ncbi:MAG TPA: acyl-CoA dehydrogenase family protein [Trebonia sp.]|nr:acyl-CoA dehydrogenase family protein [Trebonia sp.]
MDTPEQAALRQVVRDFCARHTASPGVLADGVTAASTWQRLAGELGLPGLAIGERHGGMGGGLAEVAVAAQELGRVLLPVPYLSTALAGVVLGRGSQELAARLLPGLARGEVTAALAVDGQLTVRDDGPTGGALVRGQARHVLDGAEASLFLAGSPAGRLYAVRAADAAVAPAGTLDQSRTQATVTFSDATAIATGADAGRAVSLLRALLAAESAAAAQRCLEVTVGYLKTRSQFGRVIGSFQALRHRCADLAVEVTAARATAAAAIAAGPAELEVTAALAKLYCADVFWHAAAEMIQLHGGIGFTWEHQAHRYLKRAKTTQLLLGTPGELRALVGDLAGLG